jgi:hypothetical protein
MRPVHILRNCAALMVCLGLANFAPAALITTLYNTGVDASGNPLADGASDPHYNITTTPAGAITPQAAFVVDQNGGGYPFTVWEADSSISKWISIDAQEDVEEPSSTSAFYTYVTTFNLTGFLPTTASITGKLYEDDIIQDILINTTDLHLYQGGGNASGAGFPFNITTGFVAGTNTLTFIVENYPTGVNPNPTGLNVQMTGTATAVPEPASLGFLAVGAALSLRRRARRA